MVQVDDGDVECESELWKQPEQSQFTYTGTPTGQGSGFNTYIAQQLPPIPALLDLLAFVLTVPSFCTSPSSIIRSRRGRGNVESVNPDGTARAMAPLTLSGEQEDGTVSSVDARGRRQALKQTRGREQELLQVPQQVDETQTCEGADGCL
eukprot:764326-Hanusia_phi.AAC.1